MRSGTALGRARGLGSSKAGTEHWLYQRITAVSNLFLMLWLLFSVAQMIGYDHASAYNWLRSPWRAIPMVLLVLSVFYHFRLGLQVVIEDYQTDASRIVLLLLLNFFTVAAGGIAIFSILKVAFGAVA